MKIKTEGTEVLEDLRRLKHDRFWAAVRHSPLVCILYGLWIFCEGTALVVLSLYAIWTAHMHGGWNEGWRIILTISGVLVLVPAAPLLAKFFKNVGEVK